MAEHAITQLIEDVDTTHPGLGNLAAMAFVAAKARKCLLVISPPGCGKSAVGDWLSRVHPDAYKKQSVTRSSLKVYEEMLNGFRGCIIFDDIGAIDTEWSRIQTLVTMAEMVYGHFISKDSHQLHIDIDDFQGSAILNIQPNVLKEVVSHPTWHSNLADKSLRYYHLNRATAPNRNPIAAKVDWGLDLDEIESYIGDHPIMDRIHTIAQEQWTRPRALEHSDDLLRAVAALNCAPMPDDLDAWILLQLMRPMTIEMEMMDQAGFGSATTLNDNLLYLMVEFATYPQLTYEDIGRDYHMRPSKVQAILTNMIDWFEKIGFNPVRLQPSARLIDLMKKAGVECASTGRAELGDSSSASEQDSLPGLSE